MVLWGDARTVYWQLAEGDREMFLINRQRQLIAEYGGAYWCEKCRAWFITPSEQSKIQNDTCPFCGGYCSWYSDDVIELEEGDRDD